MSFDPGQQIDVKKARSLICDIIESGQQIIVSGHAKERMNERGYTMDDVIYILQRGKITKQKFHTKTNCWRYTLSGDDLEGDKGGVVTAIISRSSIVVITTLA